MQVEAISGSVTNMLQSTQPVKVLPVTTRGTISGYPHTFLVCLTVAPGELAIQYLDSCTSNEELNAEREAALGSLRSLLHHCDRDAGWSAVAWSEFDGWPEVPQQRDGSSCLLLSYWNATKLASGAEAGHLPEVPWLRGNAARLLVLKIIRSLLFRHHRRDGAGEEAGSRRR